MSSSKSSMDEKFDEMRLENEEDFEAAYGRAAMMFAHEDENSFPALKMEKNESQLLHKNFYNGFIDFLDPFAHHKPK